MDRAERARKIIERILYITIASASPDAVPRSTPVFAAYDEQYNFYWTSLVDTEHSKNIRANSKIYFTIFDSTLMPGEGEGVYVQAHAVELTDVKEIEKAAAAVYQRKNKSVRNVQDFLGDAPKRMYKAIPEKVWVVLQEEAKHDPANVKKEVTLV